MSEKRSDAIVCNGSHAFINLLEKFPDIFRYNEKVKDLRNVDIDKDDSEKITLIFYSNDIPKEDKSLYITIGKNVYVKEVNQTFDFAWDLSGRFACKESDGSMIISDIYFYEYFELEFKIKELFKDKLYDLLFEKKDIKSHSKGSFLNWIKEKLTNIYK